MRIKPWLMISFLVVMILPIVALYFFYISLVHFDEKRDFTEYMETMEKINDLQPLLTDPSFYQVQSVEHYEELQAVSDPSMNITLYRMDGLKLYSTIDQLGVDMFSRQQRNVLYKDLNQLKKDYRTYSYKQPVFDGHELIGIYEITLTREEWLEEVNQQKFILGALFMITIIVIFSGAMILLNRKLNRPLQLLRNEMTAFANGEKRTKKLPRSKDEIGDLIIHFEKMREQIEQTNKEIEKEQQEKEYIVASLSHDLKTPLTSIRAYFEALNSGENLTKQEIEEYRGVIFEKLDYMKEMIDDLNLFTTLKSRKRTMDFVEVDGDEFFEMLLTGFEEPTRKQGIDFSVEQAVSGQYVVNVKQMVRVVDNLMTNAMRFTEKGNRIWLAAIGSSSPLPEWIFPPYVEEIEAWRKNGTILIVQNEGKAIPQAELDTVFEPFVQVDSARGMGGSSGLGLSIAKMVMEQHGGKIKLWSHVDYGTIVACWLKEG